MTTEYLGKVFNGFADERRYHNVKNASGTGLAWQPVEGRFKILRVFTETPLTFVCQDLDRPDRERWFTQEEIDNYLGVQNV